VLGQAAQAPLRARLHRRMHKDFLRRLRLHEVDVRLPTAEATADEAPLNPPKPLPGSRFR
jgi:hypothetical protein